LEKDIKNVFKANLPASMGLELVESEFTIKNKRIDTMAYDSTKYLFRTWAVIKVLRYGKRLYLFDNLIIRNCFIEN